MKQVKSIKGADVLQLSYESKIPQEAAAVVNLVMEFYLKTNILSNRAEAVAARGLVLLHVTGSAGLRAALVCQLAVLHCVPHFARDGQAMAVVLLARLERQLIEGPSER